MRYFCFIFFVVFFSAMANAQDKSFLNSYDKYWEIEDSLYRVMVNGKIGLVNQRGDVIIPCENDQVWNLHDNGNVKVLKEGKLGIYNINGDLIIPAIYDMIWDFEQGKARVLRQGKVGYVNSHGNEFIPCKYDQVWGFEDGVAKVLKNGKTGFVNLSGYEYIPTEYQKIWDFEAGKAKVLKNGKMGYINMQGVEIIPCEYQYIGEFEDGVAKVVRNGVVSYVDMYGNPSERMHHEDMDTLNPLTDELHAKNEITKVELSQNDKDTTVIKIFGSKIAVVNDDGAKEFSIDSKYNYEWRDNKKKSYRAFEGHYQGVDLGLNNYMSADGDFSLPDAYSYLSLNTGKSVEFSLNALQQNISLSRKGNVGFVTGLGLNYNNYRFDNPNIPVLKDGNLSYMPIDEPLEKNKLTTLYLTAPLLFEVQLSQKRKEAFYISMGVVGGYRIRSHTKIVTKKDGDRSKDKNRDSFALNDFRYGAYVRFGYDVLNFFGSYYFSPMFEDGKGPELYPISFGVALYPGRW